MDTPLTRFLLPALLLLAGTAPGETLILQDGLNGYAGTKDGSIFKEVVDNTSGADIALYVGDTQLDNPRRALLRFDLSAIPRGSLVTSATLVLHVDRAHGDSNPELHKLHRLHGDWGESTHANPDQGGGGHGVFASNGDVTWKDRHHAQASWTTAGGDFDTTPSATAFVGVAGTDGTFSTQGMIADVQAWVNTPASNDGWMILGDETAVSNARRLCAREFSTAAFRPKLVVEFERPRATGWVGM